MRTIQHLACRGLAMAVLSGCAMVAGAQQPSSLPDSPGTVRQHSPDVKIQMANLTGEERLPPAQVPASSEQQSSSVSQAPVGTAAAEAPNISAITASEPAGAAIAPAKQHRVRTIVLRTGAIIGTVVAVSAVVALTSATSSKPPGAH